MAMFVVATAASPDPRRDFVFLLFFLGGDESARKVNGRK